jgi:hypothetical protein
MRLTLTSTGTDQTATLQALYDGAHDGDIIELEARDGKPFVVGSTLNWTADFNTKTVNVHAENATITAAPGFTGPLVTFGAPPGKHACCSWSGGTLNGTVELQNLGYADFDPFKIVGALKLSYDDKSAYLSIHCRGGLIGSNGPAVIVNAQNDLAWANSITFREMHLFGAKGQPTIQVLKKTAYPPGLWMFEKCVFEQDGGVMFDAGIFRAMFSKCYYEPAQNWQLGAVDPLSQIIFQNYSGNVPPWFVGQLSPPCYFEGMNIK